LSCWKNGRVRARVCKRNRWIPILHDREKYRWRNLVERTFSGLKNWRRVATRCDNSREPDRAFIALASIKLWTRFFHKARLRL